MRLFFSLFPVYAVISVLIIIGLGSGIFPNENVDTGWKVLLGVMAVLVGLITIIGSFGSVFTHVQQLGQLQHRKQKIEHAEEHIKNVQETIKMVTDVATDIDESLIVKSNVDHPVVKAMRELTEAQDKLLRYKNDLAHIRGEIYARKHGPFGWVVKMYGEGE